MPIVSIIMPLYNKAAVLPETLASVFAQSFENWELIIVDDGSDDGSLAIADAFQKMHSHKCKILQSDKARSGASAARNKGLSASSGSFIVFLDGDDLLEPFCLQQRINVMQEDSKTDWAVFSQYKWFPEINGIPDLYNRKVTSKTEAIHCFLQMNPPWQTMAVIWRKKALMRLGGFDEELYFMEDPYLHLSALLFEDLRIKFCFDFPADSYYRIIELNGRKLDLFYHNSIVSRFIFMQKIVRLISSKTNTAFDINADFKKSIRKGFVDFIKIFLAKRLGSFLNDYNNAVKTLSNKKVLNNFDVLKLNIFRFVFSKKSSFVNWFHLKGLIFKIL